MIRGLAACVLVAFVAAQVRIRRVVEELAVRAPARERAYVATIVKRYSNDPKADLKALAMEAKVLMSPHPAAWHDLPAVPECLTSISHWSPEYARKMFLREWHHLTKRADKAANDNHNGEKRQGVAK